MTEFDMFIQKSFDLDLNLECQKINEESVNRTIKGLIDVLKNPQVYDLIKDVYFFNKYNFKILMECLNSINTFFENYKIINDQRKEIRMESIRIINFLNEDSSKDSNLSIISKLNREVKDKTIDSLRNKISELERELGLEKKSKKEAVILQPINKISKNKTNFYNKNDDLSKKRSKSKSERDTCDNTESVKISLNKNDLKNVNAKINNNNNNNLNSENLINTSIKEIQTQNNSYMIENKNKKMKITSSKSKNYKGNI